MDIGLDREARPGQQPAGRDDVVAIEPETIGELEPARDTAVALRLPIVVDEARAPLAAHGGIVAAGDQARILDRDHRLVIVAIERPGLDLALAAFAVMQEAMKRVQPVIAFGADAAQLVLPVRRV